MAFFFFFFLALLLLAEPLTDERKAKVKLNFSKSKSYTKVGFFFHKKKSVPLIMK